MDDSFHSENILSSNSPTAHQQTGTFAPVLDDLCEEINVTTKPNLLTSFVAGATAGIVVDISLFPLDTLKTRLQSKQGFRNAGGFRGVYKGIGPVILGSAPTSAMFFCTYNSLINYLKKERAGWPDSWINIIAAAQAEINAAIVRVPLELVKQRKQTSPSQTIPTHVIMRDILKVEGVRGLYRGFTSTIAREIPFAALQFPLWEYFKRRMRRKHQRPVTMVETALCGAAAGFISAALTTPMDVIKTRIMLAKTDEAIRYGRLIVYFVARDIFHERGILGFFAGVVPRVLWISIGGFIYFGMYESMKFACEEQTVIPMTKSQ